MGFDTYFYVERRSRDPQGQPGPWTFVPWSGPEEPELLVPGTDLNPVFFGFPNDPERVRGLPKDLSPELRRLKVLPEAPEEEGLGPSWLTLEELVAIKYPPLDEGEEFPVEVLGQLRELGPLADVRVVFFFN